MNKKLIPILGVLLLLPSFFISLGNEKFSTAEGLTSSDWIQCDADPGEDVTGNADDYNITGLQSFGRRVRTKNLFKIDGLTFDYDVSSFKADQGEKFNLNGFWFSTNTNSYVDPSNHTNEAIYTMTSKLSLTDGQDRFGIFSHHNIFEPGTNLANVKCYTDTNKSTRGFGFDDGTMIMTHRSENVQGLRFKFKAVANTSLYKVTITELYSNTMWQDKQYNVNYNNGSTFVYVDASSFNMNANGEAYLFVYGYKTDDADSSCIPNIHIRNLKVFNGYLVSFNTNGGTAIPAQTIEEGGRATRPATDPTRVGYNFDNWYKDSGFLELYDFNAVVTNDIVIFAKWNIKTFTVTFVTNGVVSIPTSTVNYGAKAKAPTFKYPSNYKFEGWFSDAEFTTFFDFDNVTITKDTSIFGKFTYLGAPAKDPTTTIVVVCCVVGGAALLGVAAFFIIRNQKKRKLVLDQIEKHRQEFKEKNHE